MFNGIIFNTGKVKYIKKEANINIVPLPKSVNLIDPSKHILLSKKIKVFILLHIINHKRL